MKFIEGDKVQIVTREVTDEDRKLNRYFDHMAGLTGSIQNIYGENEIAVRIDESSLSKASATVHKEATLRMRAKFVKNVSEEQRKELTKEEIDFNTHFMLLVQANDLVKA
jgi:predicted proteasome-type protease